MTGRNKSPGQRSSPKNTFDDILKNLNTGVDKSRKGQRFENVMKKYFLADPMYSGQFTDVWLWKESPLHDHPVYGGKDYGIDLVGREIDGSYCAIQSKFYGRDNALDWKGLLKLLTSVGENKPFKHCILVYTGKKLTKNQMKHVEINGCRLIDYASLKKSKVDWDSIAKGKPPKPIKKFKERPHQKTAREDVIKGLKKADRGKMIMACGTGKTFVTLKIAEQIAGKGGTVLYLVPSISLMQQSIREWAEQKTVPHSYIGVCSDTRTGRNDEDASIAEIEIPVTTDVKKITEQLDKKRRNSMTVVFSTYQSLLAVSTSQKKTKMIFDLVICDEAHRTTGVSLQGAEMVIKQRNGTRKAGMIKQDLSYFVAIHEDRNIKANKRLYTTATPKIYPRFAKQKARKKYHKDFDVFSMDNKSTYGDTLHHLKFSDAIDQGLLSDYRVVVLTVTEEEGAEALQKITEGSTLNIENMGKMVGCWRALRDPEKDTYTIGEGKNNSYKIRDIPLQRAIVFSHSIAESKKFNEEFPKIANIASAHEEITYDTEHVDGGHNALERREKLNWLEDSDNDENQCRVLSNARCLTEGVDVPTLDAVIFMSSRTSTIDIIQAVGRVMRKADGKDYGYIIIPIVVKSNASVQQTLEGDDTYGDVWDVIRALRAHDDRIEQYLISGNIPNMLITKPKNYSDKPNGNGDFPPPPNGHESADELRTNMEDFLRLIRTKLADKVGDRRYLESWANDVAKIVVRIKLRISTLLKNNHSAKKEFDAFHLGLKKIINNYITYEEATDMLAQHMIMGRVFDSLFKDVDFVKDNHVSRVIDGVIKILHNSGLGTELEDLEDFYKDVETRVASITTHEGRHRVMIELYDKFFTHAFKDTAERLGIVYTPVEIVDFILRSADEILRDNFGKGFSNKDVHIIDPFVGTGSFISRLMSEDLNLIRKVDLEYKYKNRLHANEIILLAYYVAAVNCESTFAERTSKFASFNGLILTDTFHRKKIDEQWNAGLFSETEKQLGRQGTFKITAITGNPPWSVGDKKFKGGTKLEYKELNKRIDSTYIQKLKKINNNIKQIRSLYDSYIRSLRWASDRIGESGIIAFVTNASFIRSDTAAGVRACLEEEFSNIWCLDLLGQKGVKNNGRNIFEYTGRNTGGTTLSSVIIILVKNNQKKNCTIRYYQLDSKYYSGQEKRDRLKELKSISNIKKNDWIIITPDKHYDWLDQRSDEFSKYMPMWKKQTTSKKKHNIANMRKERDESQKKHNGIFELHSGGISTSRDVWAYNSSKDTLSKNMKQHIDYCNSQNLDKPIFNSKQAKWSSDLSKRLKRSTSIFRRNTIRIALYRPFFKQYLYFDDIYNERQSQIPKIFPENYSKNLVICIADKGKKDIFSTIVTDVTPDLHIIEQSQCFPLYVYENKDDKKENILNSTLTEYRKYYKDDTITKKKIFYYVYAMLHHSKYRKKFANNLSRELPHIPMAPNFHKFSKAGEKLVDLHLNYETCKKYNKLNEVKTIKKFYKLSFSTFKDGKKHMVDKTKILIDGNEIFDNLPKINYQVNGRTPLEWIVDRYKITEDKENGIINDPCTGTDIISIIKRATYVGIESDRLISTLPEEFESNMEYFNHSFKKHQKTIISNDSGPGIGGVD